MKKKEILNKLNAEIESLTPKMSELLKQTPISTDFENDLTEKQAKAQYALSDGTRSDFDNSGIPNDAPAHGKSFSFGKRLAAFCTAFVCVGAGLIGTVVYLTQSVAPPAYVKYDSYVTVNINPSFSITADSDGKVTAIIPNNRDAEIVLINTDIGELYGKSCENTVAYITFEASKLGYFSSNRTITVTAVSGRGKKQTEKLLSSVKSSAEEALTSIGISNSVIASKNDRNALARLCESLGITVKNSATISDITESLSAVPGYLKGVANKLGSDGKAEENVKYAYRSELLDEYIEIVEDRAEKLEELYELNEQIYEQSKELTLTGLFGINGWELIALSDQILEDCEELKELKEEFCELLKDLAAAGLDVDSKIKFDLTRIAYLAVDFEKIEEKLEALEDAIDRFQENISGNISKLIDHIIDVQLGGIFAEEWAMWSEGFDDVTDPESYVEAMTDRFKKEYEKRISK